MKDEKPQLAKSTWFLVYTVWVSSPMSYNQNNLSFSLPKFILKNYLVLSNLFQLYSCKNICLISWLGRALGFFRLCSPFFKLTYLIILLIKVGLCLWVLNLLGLPKKIKWLLGMVYFRLQLIYCTDSHGTSRKF